MAEHLTEDEQVEALKKWWKENGTAIVIGLVVGLGVVIGVRYWFSYQETVAVNASSEYDKFTAAVQKKDAAQIKALADTMREKFKGTSYAALTALQIARQDVEAEKLAEAEKNLRWALDNPGHKVIGLIARQRLAEVLYAENKLDDALSVLDQAKDPTFAPRFAMIRGDILRKQGKAEQAREAYQLALTDTSLTGKAREYVQMKLDDLSDSSAQNGTK